MASLGSFWLCQETDTVDTARPRMRQVYRWRLERRIEIGFVLEFIDKTVTLAILK